MTERKDQVTVRLPGWLVFAVVLLLLAQTIQFGLLFALLTGVGGVAAAESEPAMPIADMEPSSKRLELRDPAEMAAALELAPAAEDEDEEIEDEAPTPASSAVRKARAAPKPTGTIRFEGTTGYVVGARGKTNPGALPPGDYEVYLAQAEGSAPALFDNVALALGDDVLFRCGFGRCRRIQ